MTQAALPFNELDFPEDQRGHRTIVLEGPDEVGKTTLAQLMCGRQLGSLPAIPRRGAVYDRSWVTNMVYRIAMPMHDWSAYSSEPPTANPEVDLVILLPDFSRREKATAQTAGEHGYSAADYDRVVRAYHDVYALLATSASRNSGLFRSVSLLRWTSEYELIIAKSTDSLDRLAAHSVIDAANKFNNIK